LLAISAEFVGLLFVVHLCRLALARRRSDDA
jgi:hypothetical protein